VKGEDKMKSFLKINIGILLSVIVFCGLSHAEANASTGHDEFTSIKFLYNPELKLIVEMSESERVALLNRVKRKAFGWSTYTNYRKYEIEYEAGTIFSRSNTTNQVIEFHYSTATSDKKTKTSELSGTLGMKLSGKFNKITASLDSSIRGEIGKKSESTFKEEMEFKVKIEPGRRVSLMVKGLAKLSNGASKYYLFGISAKKEIWEYIDVVNEYYELTEEIVM